MYENAFKGTSPSKATFHLLHAEIIKRVKSQDQSVCVISHLVRKVNNPPLLFSIVSHNSFVYVLCLYYCLPCLQFHTWSACFQFYTHDFDPRPLNTAPLYIKIDLTCLPRVNKLKAQYSQLFPRRAISLSASNDVCLCLRLDQVACVCLLMRGVRCAICGGHCSRLSQLGLTGMAMVSNSRKVYREGEADSGKGLMNGLLVLLSGGSQR